jgi:hypothetical protein
MEQLGRDDIIDSVLASGIRSGYHFEMKVGPDKTMNFTARATPLEPGKSGRKYFFTDEAQVVRCTMTPPATVQSPPCK